MDLRLGIVIPATLLVVVAAAWTDPSDHFCASFSDAHEPCGCTIIQRASYNPICGSDGLTYLNECYMACRNIVEGNSSNIYMVHSGACNEGCSCKCKGTYDPICGSDGITYSNECTLMCTQEKQKSSLQIEHSGECDAGDRTRKRRDDAIWSDNFLKLIDNLPSSTTKELKRPTKQTKPPWWPMKEPKRLSTTENPTTGVSWTTEEPKRPSSTTKEPKRPLSTTKEPKRPSSSVKETKRPPSSVKETKRPPSSVKETKRPPSSVKETKRPPSSVKETKRPPSSVKETKRPSSSVKETKRLSSTTKPVPRSRCLCSAVYKPVCGKKGDYMESFINFCAFFCMTKKNPKLEFSHWGQCIRRKINK